jgi:GAF domain-containing protein
MEATRKDAERAQVPVAVRGTSAGGREALVLTWSCARAGGVTAQETGVRSAVGTPIIVEGRLWGVMAAGSTLEQLLPADTEARLASFTELVATAIANAESRAALAASRARIVAAADETRRRIERDLHDGTQQQLVSLLLELRAVQAAGEPTQLGGRDWSGSATE